MDRIKRYIYSCIEADVWKNFDEVWLPKKTKSDIHTSQDRR